MTTSTTAPFEPARITQPSKVELLRHPQAWLKFTVSHCQIPKFSRYFGITHLADKMSAVNFWNLCLTLITLLLLFISQSEAVDAYRVQFEGITSQETLNTLQSTSQLVSLQESPPTTNAGLKRRADSDLPNLIKVMQSFAYFNAKIEIEIDFASKPVLVHVKIDEGPIYPFAHFNIIPASAEDSYAYETISLTDIGIELGQPACPKLIIEAQETLLEMLTSQSHPLARIVKKEIIADQKSKTITVEIVVDSGPFCYFGCTSIKGNSSVCDEFFLRKMRWRKWIPYNPCLVEETQLALETTGLFNSVTLEHFSEVAEDGTLPMRIEVMENKHRSIGAGLSYTTDYGAGGMVEWEHRNVRGMGERLSLEAGIWQKAAEGKIIYTKPDFCCPNQDLIWLAEVEHERTKGFNDTSYSLSTIVEKQVDEKLRISYGTTYKYLHDTHSDNNRAYHLVKTPYQLRWSDANNPLDPTQGMTLNFRLAPAFQLFAPNFAFATASLVAAFYAPLNDDHSLMLATKINLGTIIGAPRHMIPPSERLYAGSENTLRGYPFESVSPLNEKHKPIGGKSLMVYSLEMRARQNETLGWVLFYEIGNVYKNAFPDLKHRLLQSAGVGVRYLTPVGPLRFDIAFPLLRRRHIDKPFQLYLSIGQAF